MPSREGELSMNVADPVNAGEQAQILQGALQSPGPASRRGSLRQTPRPRSPISSPAIWSSFRPWPPNGNSRRGEMERDALIAKLAEVNGANGGRQNLFQSGILEIIDEGYGFLRRDVHWLPSRDDIYVSQSQIRRFGLRTGDDVSGQVRNPKSGEKYQGLVRVVAVNNMDPETTASRPIFERLTPIFPDEHLILEHDKSEMTTRVIDLVAPIGRGQRGLIVSPPKAGKTELMKRVARGLLNRYNDLQIIVALIGERPEEVTDWERSVAGAEVISSTFDETPESHCRVAEMTTARAKRLVESGGNVVVFLDSITRLSRAYNLSVPTSGKTLSGGIDPRSARPSKDVLRVWPQHRTRRQSHHARLVPGRHRQPHG